MSHDPAALDAPSRLAALARTGLLDSLPEESFDRITRMAARILGVPIALVSLVDDRRQFFKSAVGLAEPVATARETPLSHSFCQHVVTSRRALVVDDALAHPTLRHNGAVADLGVMAYLGVPLTDPAGETLGALCAIDVKARAWAPRDRETLEELAAFVMTEVALREALDSLRQEAEIRERFVSVLAHDLRQPLSTIAMGAGFLLRDSGLGAVGRRRVEQIHGAGLRMGRMVNDLLDLASSRLGWIPLDRCELDLHAVVAAAVAELRVAFPDRALELTHEGDGRGVWDADRLSQLLGNLVGNAAQYAPPGRPVCVAVRGRGAHVVLSVQNDNPGEPIPAEVRARLFHAFTRAAAEPGQPGRRNLGLGLYIVEQIARSHGGTVAVESTAAEGTTFVVTLPRAPA